MPLSKSEYARLSEWYDTFHAKVMWDPEADARKGARRTFAPHELNSLISKGDQELQNIFGEPSGLDKFANKEAHDTQIVRLHVRAARAKKRSRSRSASGAWPPLMQILADRAPHAAPCVRSPSGPSRPEGERTTCGF